MTEHPTPPPGPTSADRYCDELVAFNVLLERAQHGDVADEAVEFMRALRLDPVAVHARYALGSRGFAFSDTEGNHMQARQFVDGSVAVEIAGVWRPFHAWTMEVRDA